MKRPVTELALTRAGIQFRRLPCQLRLTATLLMALVPVGCGTPLDGSGGPDLDMGRVVSGDPVSRSASRHLLSGVQFQRQQSNGIRHRLFAASIRVVPRGFGAFNANGVNELLVEDPHIEIFPVTDEETTQGEHSGAANLTDTLSQYIDTLPDEFGLITRIHMRNVRITLHQRGQGGTSVNVVAKQLLKELGDDSDPELYRVSFQQEQASGAALQVPWARWNTRTSQFIVKSDRLADRPG